MDHVMQAEFGAATHALCPRDELLHLIRALNPAIVTLYEEDCDTTLPSVVQRVQQSFAYEWMPFDFLATFWLNLLEVLSTEQF